MTSLTANRTPCDLYAVYAIAALIICGVAAGLRFLVPQEVVGYVSNGLMLPLFRYGLLFALIACGVALSNGQRPMVLALHLAILASATWFGLLWAEPIILPFEALAELIVQYPVVTAAMCLTAGSALLLPVSARWVLLPAVSVICGFGLGLSVILDSPFDYYAGWFSWAGGAGGLAIVLVSMVLADGTRRVWAGPWITIAERITGSWLIAASLMLSALALVS